MAESLGEKTEAPTGRRLNQARQRGQVPKSQDLSAVISLAGAVIVLAIFGPRALREAVLVLRRTLDMTDGTNPLTVEGAATELGLAMVAAGEALWPPILVVSIVVLAAQIMQVGFLFTTKPITPDVSKLNPMNGIKRLVGKQNAIKAGSNIAKMLVVIGVSFLVMRGQMDRVGALMNKPLWYAVEEAGWLCLELVAWLLVLLLVVAIIDWIFQKWQHKDKLKMTKQEVKEERKSAEGDIEMRGKRMRMGRELIMQQVNQAVPNADVVVTNPTHFSVALRYDSEGMRAPRVIAKGADLLAFRIRQLAQMHGVPLVERPPLARALYAGVEVGREISPEHYQAVAEVLAYVYRLNEEAGGRGAGVAEPSPPSRTPEPQPAA